MRPEVPAVGGPAAGAIYDLGYRRYDGPRLGRTAGVLAIYTASLRAAFGLGRSGRSKVVPWGLIVIGLVPAMVAIAVRALVGELVSFVDYDSYVWQIGVLPPLFVAAQAAELVVNDGRYGVLPLYFSRPIERLDYVAAKVAALATAVLGLTALPVLVLFIGLVLASADLGQAVADEAHGLWVAGGSGVLHAAVLSAIALAIASYAGRRAYAVGAVIALFLVTGAVGGVLGEIEGGAFDAIGALANPMAVLDGTRQWLFGGVNADSPVVS
ncbi:MAG TPA: ABC transporter permease, partial [Candidatus Limnocylindria bacterium]|nr:ABC transporter permease [Candidatus Limnocylindria bacterium]